MAIFSAIAAAIGLSGFFATAFIAAAEIGTSLLISYAVSALSGHPEKQKADNSFGVQGQLQGGGAVPRTFGLGYHATAGSLVFANTHGTGYDTPNAYLTQVIALSDLPGERLVGLWVNGSKVTLADGDASASSLGSSSIGYAVPEYVRAHNGDGTVQPHLWIKFYDGTQTTADSYLVNNVATVDRPYDSTQVGRGVCYAIIHALVDENLWNGFPQFKFELSGVPLYDPSRDTTVGGSGSQRYSDPSTWGGDGDQYPAVQIYNILRGFRYNGVWFYGLQNMTAARLPVANWLTQIDKCRTLATESSGLQPTYRTGGQINIDAQSANAIEGILTGCQGRISEIGGFYKIHLGAPDSPSFSFSDDDIVSTESQSYRPFFSLADSVNGIQATYPDPVQGWNTATSPAYYRSDLEARDGNRRLMANPSFDFVPYPEQAQRLQKSAIEEAQRARTHSLTLPPAFWTIEPGDVGTWTSVRNGYTSKQFRVDTAADRANLDISLELTEVDPTDFSWDTGTDFQPVTGGGTADYVVPAQAIESFDAQPYTLLDGSGIVRRPAILISWDGSQPGVSAVQYEIRLASDQSAVTKGRVDRITAGNRIVTESILPNVAYQARGQFIPSIPRDMLWSSWITVTTPNILFSLADFDAALKAQITTIQDSMQAQIDDATQQIAALASDIASRTWLDKKEVRSDLYAVAGNARADIATLQQVVVDNQTAFANYQVTVSAAFGSVNAAVTTQSSAIATLNGYAAASYGVTLDVNGYVTGYKLINSGTGSSAFVITADKFQIALPSAGISGAPVPIFTIANVNGSPKTALRGDVFADGTVTVNALNTASLSTLSISSPTGKMVIDMANGVIKIYD